MALTPRRVGFLLVALSGSLAPIRSADVPTFDSNPSTNVSKGYDDVATVDTAWDDYYAPYEGRTSGQVHSDDNYNSTDSDLTPDVGVEQGLTPGLGRRAAQDFYLRLMPLGASIVEGARSTDGNGFRRWIREQLRWKGWKVNMVGSRQTGEMKDRDHEGHPGWITSEIHGAFTQSKGMMPNLVLLNAGTNDCIGSVDTDNVHVRYKDLLDDIFNSIPGVTVVASTLVWSRDKTACAQGVSQQIRDLVKNSYQGKRIGIADINEAISVDPDQYMSDDGIHPNDAGYKLFASVWWDSIRKLEDQIQPPNYVASIDDSKTSDVNTCSKVAGNARGPVQSQVGSGHDDGVYKHSSKGHSPELSARIEKRDDPLSIVNAIPEHMFFANIVVGDPNFDRKGALDDWIRVFHDAKGKNTYYYRQNQGAGKFGPSTTFSVDYNCDTGPRYAFADFNNDGYDDFFCIRGDSSITVSINQKTNPPTFKLLGQVVPGHAGFNDLDVRIADIDGDGRADYCLVESSGFIICSRNAGQGLDYFWQGFKTEGGLRERVFDKYATQDHQGIVLTDLNGDFRDDFLFIGNNGNVQSWMNMRGWGSGIVPDWQSAGLTHPGQGDTNVARNIKFGRIFGSGRRDYIYLKEEDTYFDLYVWENLGGGSTKRKADGNYYCDMRGTGRDDYVWIYQDGHAAEIFANIKNPPNWGHDVQISLSVPGPRNGIHLADWNGDGKCDVLVQNKATGAITPYINEYNAATNTLTFRQQGATRALCTTGWGVNIFDRGMAVVDIDGDKRADVLCLETTGRITGFLNKLGANGMTDVGQIKKAAGWDRANLRFADVESSGRTDIIWLNKYTGAGRVFKNNGRVGDPAANSGSSFGWTDRGVLYSPINRGECMRFSNQGGLGRADLLEVLPLTNRAWTYFNECGGGSGGDDASVGDPNLPPYTAPGEPGDYGDISTCKDIWYKVTDIPTSTDIPYICKMWNVLLIWERVLNDSVIHYNNLMRDDYDKKFQIYAKYTVDQSGENIQKKMESNGKDYFDCDVWEQVFCCTGCEDVQQDDSLCKHCAVDTGNEPVCQIDSPFGGPKFEYRAIREPCPPDFSERGGQGNHQSTTWYIRSGDRTRFFEDVGIEENFVNFTERTIGERPISDANSCARDPSQDVCKYTYKYYQFPQPRDDYGPEDIPNPKDMFNADGDGALKQLATTQDHLRTYITELEQGRADVDPAQLAWSLMPTVIMVNHSVNSMQELLETAEEVQEKERLQGIFAFLDAFFLLLPFVGSELVAASNTIIANLGRTLTGLGDAYQVGKGIYDGVKYGPAVGIAAIAGFAVGKATWTRPEASSVSTSVKLLDAGGLGPVGTPFKIITEHLKVIFPADEPGQR